MRNLMRKVKARKCSKVIAVLAFVLAFTCTVQFALPSYAESATQPSNTGQTEQNIQQSTGEKTNQNIVTIGLIDAGVNSNDVHRVKGIDFTGEGDADNNGHGSDMAKIIEEKNPEARIVSIKALNSEGIATTDTIASAFNAAIDNNVNIICIPAYIKTSPEVIQKLRPLIERAKEKNITIVAAAGNEAGDASKYAMGCFSDFENVIIVGAVNNVSKVTQLSNYGDKIDTYVKADNTSSACAEFTGVLSTNNSVNDTKKKIGKTLDSSAYTSNLIEGTSRKDVVVDMTSDKDEEKNSTITKWKVAEVPEYGAKKVLYIRFNGAESGGVGGHRIGRYGDSFAGFSGEPGHFYVMYENAGAGRIPLFYAKTRYSKQYFYTTNIYEYNGLPSSDWEKYGVLAYVENNDNGYPIYRRYNTSSGDHLYTETYGEGGNGSWISEQTAWYNGLSTIVFDPNGGTGGGSYRDRYYNNLKASSYSASKEGYTFNGWYTDPNDGTKIDDSVKVPLQDTTYYAHFTVNTYTITYNPNGKPGNAQTQTFTWDDEFELAGNVFNNGSALMCWNTKADGTGKYFEPEDAVHNPKDENGNLVTKLYAQWLPDAVTINYNANGGEFLPDEKTMNSVVYKWDGQDLTHPTLVSQSSYKEPVRDGYVFSGWESEDGAEFEGGDSIKAFSTKSTVNVSAKWTPVDQNTTLKMKDGEVIFENEPLHDVKIKKVDATTSKTLSGAGVKLQKKTSSGYTDTATKSTGSDGTAAFAGLKKGVYKIVETTAPLGYEINPKGWSFIISGANSGAAYKYSIKDLSTGKEFNTNEASDIRISDQTSPDLKLTKRDFGTDEPLRGGEFTLMNSWGLAYPAVKADENGVINFGPVPTGTYTLKEKSAPSGYSPYAAGWTIKIEQSGTEKKVTVTLNKQSGDSAVNKEGLDGDASTKVYKFTTGQTMEGINIYNEKKPLLRVIKRSRSGANKPLSGAEFTLTPEGGGAPIVTKADSKGIVNIDGLQKNVEYLMRETKAPAGAKMSAIRWTITYDGSKVNISSTGKASNIDVGTSETYGTSGIFAPTVTITDELLNSFALVKKDGDTGKAITGARFKFLTKAEYQEYLSAKSYKNQELMDSLGINVKSKSDGEVEVPRDLVNTGEKDIEIYAVETEAPAGYNKCDDIKINISIDANDKSTKKAVFVSSGKALSLDANQKAIVPDYLYGDIGIVKKDGATMAALGGAGFKLTGTSRGGQEINESATSADGTGKLSFSGIPEGYNYIINEDQAPAGYSEPDTTWHAVVITQNSSTFTRGDGQKVTLNKGTYVYDANWKLLSKDGADYVITNNAAASVSFRKVDQNTKEGLTGAEFTLTGTSGNAAGDTRTIVTTGGTASFTSLKTGTYTLKETKAPDGYKISTDLANGYTITVKGTKNSDVTVSKNGTALTADGTDNWLGTADDPCKQYDVSNAPLVEGESFSIYKTDLGTTPLPGTKFTLKKSGYTKTVTVDADGKASFNDIPYGTYQMTETPLAGYRTSKGQGYWTVTVAKRVKSGNNITGGVAIKAADGTVLTPYKKGQMDSGYGLFIGENFIGEQGSATITGVKGNLAAGKDGKYLKAKDVNLMLKNSAGTTLKTFNSFPGDLDSLSLSSESTYTITGNYTVSDTGKPDRNIGNHIYIVKA